MKQLITLILFIFFSTASYSQKTKTYFLKNGGIRADSKEQADFIRVVTSPKTSDEYFTVTEYYKNDVLKLLGHSSKLSPITYEGRVISYDSVGVLIKDIYYENAIPKGSAIYNYPNGKLKKTIEYGVEQGMTNNIDAIRTVKYRIINFYDSTGIEILKDGNGYIEDFDSEKNLTEKGAYVNGLKDGLWKGFYQKTNDSFDEVFKNGEFISGTAKLAKGEIKKYNKQIEMPDFKGGIKSFLEYVGRNYKYPKEAQVQGISGKVIVSFVVEKDGSLTDFKLLRDLGAGTGEEALRVVKASKKWIPGHEHGIPLRVVYTLPLALNMR